MRKQITDIKEAIELIATDMENCHLCLTDGNHSNEVESGNSIGFIFTF